MGVGDSNAPFIDSSRLDLKRYARRPALAMVLADYLAYVERNPRKALDLSAESTSLKEFNDWWWKARLGKCYYKLGTGHRKTCFVLQVGGRGGGKQGQRSKQAVTIRSSCFSPWRIGHGKICFIGSLLCKAAVAARGRCASPVVKSLFSLFLSRPLST